MIEMKVMGIALDTRTGSPIVVLHDMDNRKALYGKSVKVMMAPCG